MIGHHDSRYNTPVVGYYRVAGPCQPRSGRNAQAGAGRQRQAGRDPQAELKLARFKIQWWIDGVFTRHECRVFVWILVRKGVHADTRACRYVVGESLER